jgi:acyl-CoA synthetase (AMP-forming)/AMP-acid ligase II
MGVSDGFWMLTDEGGEARNTSSPFFTVFFPPDPYHISKEVITMNVSQMIRPHVAETPNKTAIIFGHCRISYDQLDEQVTRTAAYRVPVAVEFIDEIPRLASGKALRRMLRDRE